MKIEPNHGIDASDFHIVNFGKGFFDLGFVGSLIDNEDHGILVFHFFHGLFCGKWVLNHGPFIEIFGVGHCGFHVSHIFWFSTQLQGSFSMETSFREGVMFFSVVSRFMQLCGFMRLFYRLGLCRLGLFGLFSFLWGFFLLACH
jgi:hypothetical protein